MRLLTRRFAAMTVGLVTVVAGLGLTAAPAAATPATITGTVLAADTGQPPTTGACVYAYGDSDGSLVAGACIDSTGAYTIEGLEAGVAYRLHSHGSRVCEVDIKLLPHSRRADPSGIP